MTRLLTIDAGTTGVTALVVDDAGAVCGRGYREFPQHYPRPGWVEHDPEEIWAAVQHACAQALAAAAIPAGEIGAIGLTNQRETVVVWDRRTLRPVHRGLVWQDRRTADACDALRDAGHTATIRERTGLVIDAYFSATKLAWLLAHVEGLRARAKRGELAAGTVDSWLVAKLTGGAHLTEPSNASRTMLYDIRKGAWSDELLELFELPAALLPEVRPTAGGFGTSEPGALGGVQAPITGVAGDQQAALFGQACWRPGMCKSTYGTGSFVLLNTGAEAPMSRDLVTTVAWDLGAGPVYALEGSIFATGAAVQWLRDGLGIIAEAAETGPLAASVAETGDVFLVPAFAGLGAPYWDPDARAALVGVTSGTGRAHLARAAVEAMAFQVRDVVEVMERDSGVPLAELRVDGGASVMELLCQFQADLLGVPVLRPAEAETTAIGAAYLAGLGAGVWSSTEELAERWRADRRFTPAGERSATDALQRRWREAVARARGWAQR